MTLSDVKQLNKAVMTRAIERGLAVTFSWYLPLVGSQNEQIGMMRYAVGYSNPTALRVIG